MSNSDKNLKSHSSIELYQALPALLKSLTRPEEQDLLKEVMERFLEYFQLNTGGIRSAEINRDTHHQGHLGDLKYSLEFFRSLSKALSDNNLIDWQEPIEKAGISLSKQVKEMRAQPVHLIALICEIFARGKVKYNYLALPKEIREPVTIVLQETGQIN